MGSNVCMNGLCGVTASSEWKRGWAMKSGGFAILCYNCGIAYDNVAYCEKFHLNKPGWRDCKFCEKPIHCGCIASKYLYGYLDFGGIACMPCLKAQTNRSLRPLQSSSDSDDIQNSFNSVSPINSGPSAAVESQISGVNGDKGKYQLFLPTPSSNIDPTLSIGQVKGVSKVPSSGEGGTNFSSTEARSVFKHAAQKSISSYMFAKPDNSRPTLLAQAPLAFSLGGQQGTKNSGMSGSGIGVTESNEPVKVPPFKQIQVSRHILLKPPKPGSDSGSGSSAQSPQANKVTPQQTRVARPPADARGRNQLLPRYWPKITDQELEQISRDLKSNIVPLFEKILSASDAGRIGRLVLPKACAEIYFPPISNPEGLPIRIQDINGKEWTFQFRFWPNDNSRMYVLEGVTPCIQTMQLQAGDTVIFSRMDPGNKLVVGCRKANNLVDTQEAKTSDLLNGLSGETSHTGVNEATPRKKEYGGTNGHPKKKKRSRNIGSKGKRLLMHSEDAMKLRVTWKEAQELLRPTPGAKPNVVVIENCELEEHDELPVFGKSTIFTTQASGEHEQWGQCDICFKWRRLPLDIFIPSSWTCSDNTWDPNRRSCSAPDELKNTWELEHIFGVSRGFKRKRRMKEKKITQEQEEPTGLDALALVAVSGDLDDPPSLGAATTRHPRHRPGCTCIVCIQPPSGKGNHKSTCICNACLSVKRRVKTLMVRKKKRQLEGEVEIAQGVPPKDRANVGSTEDLEMEIGETSKEKLDLNCDPNREEEVMMLAEAEKMSVTSLVNVARLPLEGYTGVESRGPCVLSRAVSETDEYLPDVGCFSPMDEGNDESKGDGK